MVELSTTTNRISEVKIPDDIRSISIVLPAHDEEENIIEAIKRAIDIVAQLPFEDYEVIVIDDGSSDRTAELVNALQDENPKIELIEHSDNIGYGASLKSGLRAANGDIVFFTDADLQFDMNELPEFITALSNTDMVIGYRFRRPEHFIRRFNAYCWGILIRVLFGLKVKDIDCAFKVFRQEVLQSIQMDSIGAFINSEILIRAGDIGFGIVELPVTHFPRKAGNSSGAKPKVIFKAFKELFKLYGILKRKGYHPRQNRAYSS
ncbi:MAG: glycosyltransferase [candidate division Zixibacteria bacterium]|nr:glycosyltransferase [candidate division Zixibacteria bacterium]